VCGTLTNQEAAIILDDYESSPQWQFVLCEEHANRETVSRLFPFALFTYVHWDPLDLDPPEAKTVLEEYHGLKGPPKPQPKTAKP